MTLRTASRDASTPNTVRLRLLAHVHTKRSADAWITPRQIVTFARQSRIDAVIVTDHDTHLGSLDCARSAGESGPFFPMAAEYRSTSGDMIAAFLSHPIATRDPLGIIAETHAQDGLIILPHPFKYSRFSDAVFEQCDLIEIFNARTSDSDNARAADAARTLGKPAVVGSDAHLTSEFGLAINEFIAPTGFGWPEILLTAIREFQMSKATVRAIRASQMIKACRRGRPLLLAKSIVRWAQADKSEQP